jgi:hypothetical protein
MKLPNISGRLQVFHITHCAWPGKARSGACTAHLQQGVDLPLDVLIGVG